MLDTIPVPADSKFGAMVARRLNASRPISPVGSLAMSGPTGTGFAPLPANMRARHGVSIPKPFDIETRKDEESGEAYRVIVRCAIANERLTVLDDWSDFPELEEGETATIFLRAEKQKKEEIDDIPETNYSIVAKVDDEEGEVDGDEEAAEDEGLVNHYPLYRIDSSGKVVVDYRDAFIRPLSWHTDERSIGQDDYPDYPTVLSLSHFYDDERNMTLEKVKAAAQLTRNCDLIVRLVANPNERQKVVYVPLLELLSLIKSGGGGGGGGGEDPEDPDAPTPPDIDKDVKDWILANVVTSLNSAKGDLVLSLSEGWLEILKNGTAVKAVGTVATSVSGLVGDLAVIGGNRISVTQEGNSLRISYDEEKTGQDVNPFEDKADTCSHPGNEESPHQEQGGGGVDASKEEQQDTGGGGGCSGCGGESTTGGSGSGSPERGADGKPAAGATGGGASAPGKEVTTPPSSGTSGTASGPSGKEIKPGSMEATVANAKTPIYTGTHKALTDTKKMNTSPFVANGTAKTMEQTSADTKKPIYSGTHAALTDTRKMNESPFKKAAK